MLPAPCTLPLSTRLVPVPATNMKNDRWQREFFAFSLALSLQVVAGRAPPASAVGVYLKLFFFSPSLPFNPSLPSPLRRCFVAATLIYLTVPCFDILTQITADQAQAQSRHFK